MELYLVRHSQPQVEANICYGQSDLPLTASYPQILQSLTAFFSQYNIEQIYSSPISRCLRLAQELNLALNTANSVLVDERLQEVNFGLWEMQNWQDIPQRDIELWAANLTRFCPPEGESLKGLNHRVAEFMQSMLSHVKEQGLEKVLLISHAGVLRCILCQLMGMPLEQHLNWQIDYASISHLHIEEDFVRLCYSNKT